MYSQIVYFFAREGWHFLHTAGGLAVDHQRVIYEDLCWREAVAIVWARSIGTLYIILDIVSY